LKRSYQNTMSGSESGSLLERASDAIQQDLDTMMAILEDNQHNIPEGEYLRGMNALGSLHKQKRTVLAQKRPGDILRCWKTLDEIEEQDEDLYDEVMEVADNIVMEICGEDSSIFSDNDVNLVRRGQEREAFQMLMNYKPAEGNAGYETSPMVLHHAIQVIMERLFHDTIHELDIVRPVSCQCGWRGAQGNWDKHVSNARHQRWVHNEHQQKFERALMKAREIIIARRENGIVYINELHATPAVRVATEEAVNAAELAGERVVFMGADGNLSWFAA